MLTVLHSVEVRGPRAVSSEALDSSLECYCQASSATGSLFYSSHLGGQGPGSTSVSQGFGVSEHSEKPIEEALFLCRGNLEA